MTHGTFLLSSIALLALGNLTWKTSDLDIIFL